MNFSNKIDQAIIDRIVNSEVIPREPGIYWPSEASIVVADKLGGRIIVGKCQRAAFYTHKEFPVSNRINPQSARKLETGKIIEGQEHIYAAEAGILLEVDKAIRKPYGDIIVSAKLDAIYKDDGGGPVIIEIKSYYGYMAKKELNGNTRSFGRPKIDNVLQLMLYLDMYPEAKYGKLRYIDRGDMEIVEHRVELIPYRLQISPGVFADTKIAMINGDGDADLSINKIIGRYQELDRHIKANVVPARDYVPIYDAATAQYKISIGEFTKANQERMKKSQLVSDWRCSYCLYRNQCIKDG